MTNASLARADLRDADFEDSVVTRADFSDTDLRGARLKGIRGYEQARWIGADVRNVNFCGAYRARRVIMDENYLDEFRRRNAASEALYRIWWITSDCGRSSFRWALCTLLVVIVFAGLYMLVDVDYGKHPTALSPLYYSIVTLTTLGYGDVVPASGPAQVVAVTEVIIGYVALGGLLSIFATKMARRAD